VERREVERRRRLDQLVGDFVARAGAAGFTIKDLMDQLQERQPDAAKIRQ
jgi:hypothetical protein